MIRSQSLLGLGRVNSKRVDPSEVDAYVWPTTADNYDMLEECGKGFSATGEEYPTTANRLDGRMRLLAQQ